jgi:hypothetical protein
MEFWPAVTVDSVLPPQIELDANGLPRKKLNGRIEKTLASQWLDQHRRVEQIVWAPGWPAIIEDKCVLAGRYWRDHPGAKCINFFIPSQIMLGNPKKAARWLRHILKLFNKDDARHIGRWLAFKVQNPGRKINHAIVLGGEPGIGKDIALVAVQAAVGNMNFHEIKPSDLFERFNPFVKSVIVRLNETHDLGDGEKVINRFALHNRLKTLIAAPPEILPLNDKNEKLVYPLNVLGLIITNRRPLSGSKRSPLLRGLVGTHPSRLRPRIFQKAGALARARRRLQPRRRISAQLRPIRFCPPRGPAQDRCVLGDGGRQHCTRG